MADTKWLDDAPDSHWLDDAPEAPTAKPAAPAKPSPGIAASAIKGAEQGVSLGFSDELRGLKRATQGGGLGARLLMSAVPFAGQLANSATPEDLKAQAEAVKGLPAGEQLKRYFFGDPGTTAAQRYESGRNEDRAAATQAHDANPWTYRGGEFAGMLLNPLTRLGGPEKGMSLGQKLLAGAKSGAGLGAAFGLGGSSSDSVGGAAADTAMGAAAGAGLGAGIPLAGAGAGRLLRPLSENLAEGAIGMGRKAISGVTSSLARRKLISTDAVEEAFRSGAIKPFSSVEGIAQRLQAHADDLSARYGEILRGLAEKGVHGPEADALARQLATDAREAAQNSIIGTRADALQSASDALRSKALPTSGQGRLDLMQAELMKRELQQAAAGDFVKEGRQSLAGDARKELAGRFREAIEQAVQDQASRAPEEAAAFAPVKRQLSNTLEALTPALEGSARAARRMPVGLHEAIGLASGMSHAGPLGAVGEAVLMHGLKERGASTMASALRGGSKLTGGLAGLLDASPWLSAPEQSSVQALLAAMRARPVLTPAAAGEEGPK